MHKKLELRLQYVLKNSQKFCNDKNTDSQALNNQLFSCSSRFYMKSFSSFFKIKKEKIFLNDLFYMWQIKKDKHKKVRITFTMRIKKIHKSSAMIEKRTLKPLTISCLDAAIFVTWRVFSILFCNGMYLNQTVLLTEWKLLAVENEALVTVE